LSPDVTVEGEGVAAPAGRLLFITRLVFFASPSLSSDKWQRLTCDGWRAPDQGKAKYLPCYLSDDYLY
jgi:hypothetical protein